MTQQEDPVGFVSYTCSIYYIGKGVAELLLSNLNLIIYFDTFNWNAKNTCNWEAALYSALT